MAPTSSANPENLQTFVSKASSATNELTPLASSVQNSYEDFYGQHYQVDGALACPSDNGAFSDLKQFLTNNQADEHFVDVVRQAFLEADSTTILDSLIATQLAQARITADPNENITVNSPTFNGVPLDSGFSNDPVCTATGHFVDTVDDFVMPETLAVLAWRRTYTSRFVQDGPLGRGWSCWANASLVSVPGGMAYRGPDGQEFDLPPVGQGEYARVDLGVEVVPEGGGYCVKWGPGSRHPRAEWTFDDEGRPVRIVEPYNGFVHLDWEDGKLSVLRHSGGRELQLEWDHERIVAVRSSDGRAVTYKYQDLDLVEVYGSSGAIHYLVDDQGRITEVIDADDVVLVHNEYDDLGRVTAQRSPFGRLAQLRYLGGLTTWVGDDNGGPATIYRHDHQARLVELVTATGARLVRDFDENGNLVRIEDLAGGVITRTYDERGNLLTEVDQEGGQRSWSYDDFCRPISQIDETGAVWQFLYEGTYRTPIALVDPLGGRTQFAVDQDDRVVGITDPDGIATAFERDAEGSVVATSIAGRVCWTIDRHPTGAANRATAADGSSFVRIVDDGGRVFAVTDANGNTRSNEFSPAGRLRRYIEADGETTLFESGSHGQFTRVTGPIGRPVLIEWDVLGNMAELTLPNGGSWTFGYDPMCQLVTVADPTGEIWRQHWSATGCFLGIEDPLGNMAKRSVDLCGRLIGVEYPDGKRLSIRRDKSGRVNSVDVDDAQWTMSRDANGRVTCETDPVGRFVSVKYSAAGRPLSVSTNAGETRITWDDIGQPSRIEEPNGGRTSFLFDQCRHLKSLTEADGQQTQFGWDSTGLLTSVRRDSFIEEFQRDARGRLVARSVNGVPQVALSYGPEGAISAVTDVMGNVTKWHRDLDRLEVRLEGPTGGVWIDRFDAVGRLVERVDPLGHVTKVSLNAAGLLSHGASPNGDRLDYEVSATGEVQSVAIGGEFLWAIAQDRAARQCQISGALGDSVSLTKDMAGRIIRRCSGDSVTSWSYDDEMGRVTTVLPDGTEVLSTFDHRGRVTAVEVPTRWRLEVERDLIGRVVSMNAPGFERRFTYGNGHLVRYLETIGDKTSEYKIERDHLGRVRSIEQDGVITRYQHDGAGQLTGADGPDGIWEWQYDIAGRLVAEQGPRGTRAFSYDDADQLVSIDCDGVIEDFQYDELGRRRAQHGHDSKTTYEWAAVDVLLSVSSGDEVAPSTTRFARDAQGQLVQVGANPVTFSGGTPSASLLALDGTPFLSVDHWPVAALGTNGPHWISCDWKRASSSPRDPWGAPLTGSLLADPSPATDVGYAGKLESVGLVFVGYRVYDPSTHSFLSRDPYAGIPGMPGAFTNRYDYAANDPLWWWDPLGLKPMSMADYQKYAQDQAEGHKALVALAIAVAATIVVVATLPESAAVLVPAAIGAGMQTAGQIVSDAETGQWDLGQLALSAAIGGSIGAVTGGLGGEAATGFMGGLGKMALSDRMLIGGGVGLGTSIVNQYSNSGKVELLPTILDTAMGGGMSAIPDVSDMKGWGPGANLGLTLTTQAPETTLNATADNDFALIHANPATSINGPLPQETSSYVGPPS